MSDTACFVLYCVIYSSVWVLPTVGYSVHGYGCNVGKSDPWVTHFKPYASSGLDVPTRDGGHSGVTRQSGGPKHRGAIKGKHI